MEREVPKYIQDALKAYDPRLALMWDSSCGGWRVVYDGEPQHAILHHVDGRKMGDLYEGAIHQWLRTCDRAVTIQWSRKAHEIRSRRASGIDRTVEGMIEDASRESELALKIHRRGARKFVGAFI